MAQANISSAVPTEEAWYIFIEEAYAILPDVRRDEKMKLSACYIG